MDTTDRALIDRLNGAAERRFATHVETDAGTHYEHRKPFGSLVDAPTLLYKFGLTLAALELAPGQRVLDFGSGSGWLARALNAMGLEAVGIDVSESAVAFAQKAAQDDPFRDRGVALQYLSYDGLRFPFEDARFDRVACFDAFHHVPNKRQVMAEFARVLKDAGRVAFSEPGGHHHASDIAKAEAQTHGILEDSVSLTDLIALAANSGFGEALVKPYPPPERLTFDMTTFERFMGGDDGPFGLGAIRNDLNYAFIVSFTKGAPMQQPRRKPWWKLWR